MMDWIVTTLHPEGSSNDIDSTDNLELFRPEINYRIVAFNVTIPVFVCIAIYWWHTLYAIVLLCLYVLFRLRRIAIWCIRVYQRYAPERIRRACVFEPSCSEYMILSIEKYGILCGIIKGVKRLLRCRFPNGGEDYP